MPQKKLTPRKEFSPSADNYYTYKDGQYSIIKKDGKSKRPGNQNERGTLEKLAQRLGNIKEPNAKLTDLQNIFIQAVENSNPKDKILKKYNIDISHNISISFIMNSMVDRLNNPNYAQNRCIDKFIDEAISSDDEKSREEIKKDFAVMQSPDTPPPKKINLANKITYRLNCATPNLIPGHLRSNRSVQEKRDPHLLISGENQQSVYKEHKRSRRVAIAARNLPVTPGTPPCQPKLRLGADGKKMAQSSSVNENPEESWFLYEFPIEDFEDGYTPDNDIEGTPSSKKEQLSPPSSVHSASPQPAFSPSELDIPLEPSVQHNLDDHLASHVARRLTFSSPSHVATPPTSLPGLDIAPQNLQLNPDAEIAAALSAEEIKHKESRDGKEKIAAIERQEIQKKAEADQEVEEIEIVMQLSLGEEQERQKNELYEREKEDKKRLPPGIIDDDNPIISRQESEQPRVAIPPKVDIDRSLTPSIPREDVDENLASHVARRLTFLSPSHVATPPTSLPSLDIAPQNLQLNPDAEIAAALSVEEIKHKESRDGKEKIAAVERQETQKKSEVDQEVEETGIAMQLSLAEEQEQQKNELYEREREDKKRLPPGIIDDDKLITNGQQSEQPRVVTPPEVNIERSLTPSIPREDVASLQELKTQLDHLLIKNPPGNVPVPPIQARKVSADIIQILQTILSNKQLEYIALFQQSNDIDSSNMTAEQAQLLQKLHLERGEHLLKLCRHPYYQNITTLRQAEAHFFTAIKIIYERNKEIPPPLVNLYKECQHRIQNRSELFESRDIEDKKRLPFGITDDDKPITSKQGSEQPALQTTLSTEQLEYIALFQQSNDIDSSNMTAEQAQLLQKLHLERGEHLLKLCRHPYYQNITTLGQAEAHFFTAIKITNERNEEIPSQLINLYKECQSRIKNHSALRLRSPKPKGIGKSFTESINIERPFKSAQKTLSANFARFVGRVSQTHFPNQQNNQGSQVTDKEKSSRLFKK